MIKKIKKKLYEYFYIFTKVLGLIWNCSRKFTILFIILNLLAGLYPPILLIVWKYFIDSVIEALNTNSILPSLIFLLIHFLVMILIDFTNQLCIYVEEIQRDYLNKHIIELTMDKISQFELYHFDNPDIYDKIEKVNNESTQRTVSLLRLTVNSIRHITTLIGSFFILIRLNVLVVIICIISCIPMFFVSTKVSVKRYSLFNERVEKLRLVHHIKYLMAKYESVKEIKIFRLGQYLKNIVSETYAKHLKEDNTVRKSYLINISLSSIVKNIISYSFKLYILLLILYKKIFTIGDLTMFITAIESFQSSIGSILNIISNLYIDSLYLENLFSLLEIQIKTENRIPFNPNFNEIEFKEVYFKYPSSDRYILKNINCKIHANKSYSLVGLNGSGKTTFIKLLTKLYEPTEGNIYIDGVDLQDIDSTSYYENIGVIFQDFIKYPFDVSKNIGVGKIDDIENIDMIYKAAEKAGADTFIERLPNKYKTFLQKEWSEGTELSIGQWQKLAISRAHMSNATIMILDEPTSSLDAEAEYNIYMQFKKLMYRKTCILISHRLSVDKFVDEIFVLKDGKLIESGTHSELIKESGEYSRLYNMQAKSYIDNFDSKEMCDAYE